MFKTKKIKKLSWEVVFDLFIFPSFPLLSFAKKFEAKNSAVFFIRCKVTHQTLIPFLFYS